MRPFRKCNVIQNNPKHQNSISTKKLQMKKEIENVKKEKFVLNIF